MAGVSSGKINRVALCGGNPDLAPFERVAESDAGRQGCSIVGGNPAALALFHGIKPIGFDGISATPAKLAAKSPAKMPHMG